MKTNYLLATVLCAVALAATTAVTYAEQLDTRVSNKTEFRTTGVSADLEVAVDATTSSKSRRDDTSKATTSDERAEKATSTRGNATSTEKRNEHASSTDDNDNDENMGDEHRSTVSIFVQSLLSVADREGGIGAQVREVARAQNDSASTTAHALEEVADRGSIRTFLFGSDYKNLGVIRRELATTTANIAKLITLRDQAITAADKAELDIQIDALEAEKEKLTDYITDNEDTFSLFGWFNKFFAE